MNNPARLVTMTFTALQVKTIKEALKNQRKYFKRGIELGTKKEEDTYMLETLIFECGRMIDETD